jgi:hypothetical protein
MKWLDYGKVLVVMRSFFYEMGHLFFGKSQVMGCGAEI